MCSLVERLDELEVERRRLSAERARLLDEVEAAGAHHEDGFLSLRTWLAHRYQLSTAEIRGRFHERAAVAVGAIGEALERGEISACAARELGRAASNPRCGDRLVEVVDPLLDAARSMRHLDLRALVREWERLADADGPAPDPEMLHERRSLRLRQDHDGAFHLTGRFGNLQGAVVEELLDRFSEAERQADLAEWDAERGELGRTCVQRDADALVTALTRAASVDPGGRAPEPLVSVIVDEATLEHHLVGELTDEVTEPIDPATFADRTCRTRHGSWLDPRELPAVALRGHVRRVVRDGAGVVVDLGRRQRLFTGAAREAVEVTTGRCAFAGCSVPVHRSEVDHQRPWADGGSTDQANAVPLCARHHRLKDRGFRTWRDPTGAWHTVRPDGSPIESLRPAIRAGPIAA
ncbi:MAG: DUF222 domain-containing protein [Actinomycetota bacterium]